MPTTPVSIAVALADKLDTLVGFWAIDEKPTGSKDPYALRRAALGVIRLVLENGLRLGLSSVFGKAHHRASIRQEKNTFRLFERRANGFCYELETWKQWAGWSTVRSDGTTRIDSDEWALPQDTEIMFYTPTTPFPEFLFLVVNKEQPFAKEIEEARIFALANATKLPLDLLAFFHERLKVYLRDKGARHDLIDAVLTLGASPTPHPSPQAERGAAGASASSTQSGAPTLPVHGEGQ